MCTLCNICVLQILSSPQNFTRRQVLVPSVYRKLLSCMLYFFTQYNQDNQDNQDNHDNHDHQDNQDNQENQDNQVRLAHL